MASQYWIPPEVWTIIFQIVSEEDDIRTCGSRVRSSKNLQLLSSCLASVVEVVYVYNRYHFVKTPREYKEALRRASSFGKFEEPKSEEEDLDLKRAFSQYCQAYNDQTTMENSGEVLACLCSALMRMPHIETVTISPNFYSYLESDCYSKYFLEPDPAYNEVFLLMVRISSLTGAKIRELDIESDDDTSGEGVNGVLFRGISHINLSHCSDAFRGLRNITITVENDVNGWMTGNLAKILSGATDLERLRVHCCSGIFHISTKYILSTTAWSRLASLDFLYATLDQGDFLDLLRRHSGTLKDIDLFCVGLTNGSWKILLEGMKSSLSLQHISIDHPYEGDDGEEIYWSENALENYLLGDGPHTLSE